MVCDVLVELAHVFIDKTFTYIIPKVLIDKVAKGMRVKVDFNGQDLEGFVLSLYEKNDLSNLKELKDVVDTYPILNDELLKLGKTVANETLSSLMTTYQAMLPLALKAKNKINMKPKLNKFIRLNQDVDINMIKLNEKQLKIINLLLKEEVILKSNLNLISASSVNTLIKNKIVIETEKEVFRLSHNIKSYDNFVLNDEQKVVYQAILNKLNSYQTFLIHGVTGSGKTNVYMEIIDEVIKNGKTAILLVPEISLTPQIISRFTSKFDTVAVLHSGLSAGEKYDEWRKIKEKKVNIVIGARSAIFAPLENIGVIIIDEEHSSTYKQENNPRYHATDIAKKRCEYHQCPLILGSATPALESFARAEKGVYTLLTLKERYNKKDPDIKIIDMNKEFKRSNGFLSNDLIKEIEKRIEQKEQIILFLNRRGYSPLLLCKACGYVEKCPNCDISLTYHKTSNMLRCHYCGYANKRSDICPECKEQIIDYGLGTERVEELLKSTISGAKVVRMDVDTTSKKKAHENIINDFLEERYNILLGTQMIAKGLDFPNVTLVGVINADISLNIPDFRASENTFQLLNQVSGRSGRGQKQGLVLIQTFNPDHYAVKYSLNNDYLGFYKEEMKVRKVLNYPPYYYICILRIIAKDYDKASSISSKLSSNLKSKLSEIVLGPSLCNPFKINNNYRFQIIIKYKDIKNIIKYLKEVEEHYFNDKNVKIEIDFNPMKL